MSSGEKVLISLVFYLYSSQEKNVFPKLLLLDEPNAHLHPTMTQQFLNVVKNVLVDKFNVRVIMTTHSPSYLDNYNPQTETIRQTVTFTNDIKLQYPIWIIKRRGKTLLNEVYQGIFSHKTVNFSTLFKALRKVNFIPDDMFFLFNDLMQ